MKISIQGGLGSYSHQATEYLLDSHLLKSPNQKSQDTPSQVSLHPSEDSCEGESPNSHISYLLPCKTFQQAFQSLTNKKADYAVIPFENSTHGSVIENYDLLTKHHLHIIKEIYLKINFHLLSLPKAKLSDITNLYTHKVSILQIKDFLNQNPQIDTHIYSDNGRAAKYIKNQNNIHNAAAASQLAAKIYGLIILKKNIHNNPKNFTRFFVLSNTANYDPNANKTSLTFEVKHQPGSLVDVLNLFKQKNINLTKIESRPILGTKWEYRFYIDFQSSPNHPKTQDIISQLPKYTNSYTILGTYPAGEYINT
jgi:prephenate dehydratase